MTNDEDDDYMTPDALALKILGSMRAVIATRKAGVFDHPQTPYGKLAMLEREEEKAKAGEEHNTILVENADQLRLRYLREGDAVLQAGVKARMPNAYTLEGGLEEWNLYPDLKPVTTDSTAEPDVVRPEKAREAMSTTALTPADVAGLSRSVMVDGNRVAAYDLDRRKVVRPHSNKPLFSELAADKVQSLRDRHGGKNKDADTMQVHADLFIELIGDHPIDTYVGADVQAFIKLLTHWPAQSNLRKNYDSARELLAANANLIHKPLKLKSLRDKYVGNIKTIINSKTSELDYRPPLAGYKFWYPDTAELPQSAEPLSSAQISAVFREGVRYGHRDEAILPLLGHLTGRRLGLLIHLKGVDFREKYPGIYVAQTSNIIQIDGRWERRPVKTRASTTFFILHPFLVKNGFVDWAMSLEDDFLFPGLMRLEDPSKSGAQYMSRLFARAGIDTGNHKEVFHSLRGGNIEEMRDAGIDARDRKLQAGHQLGEDEHELYGFKAISEARAHKIANAPLNSLIDFSVYDGIKWDALEADGRKRGRSRRTARDDKDA